MKAQAKENVQFAKDIQGMRESTKNGSEVSPVAFEMLVIKLSLVQHYASVSQLSLLGFSYILLKYLLITLKRKKKYVGAFVYK